MSIFDAKEVLAVQRQHKYERPWTVGVWIAVMAAVAYVTTFELYKKDPK